MFDVIKWDDSSAQSNEYIVYKHEAEDFNTESQIIVHENQIAVFYANGKALDILPAGRYSLKTSNLPLLRNFIEKAYGGKSVFHCEVYFVNCVKQPAVGWGFADMQDATIDFRGQVYPVQFTACGTFEFRLHYGEDGTNIRKFLDFLVGTRSDFTKKDVHQKIVSEFLQDIKTRLSETIGEKQVVEVLNIAKQYLSLAETIEKDLAPTFEERFGISLDRIVFERIKLSAESYKTIVDVQKRAIEAGISAEESVVATGAEAYKQRTEAETEAYRRQVGGYTYQQEAQREILSNAAKNEGMSGTFMGAGMGLGMGVGIGGAFGAGMSNVAQGMMAGQPQQPQQAGGATCPDCGATVSADAKFCNSCGKKLGSFCPDCGAPLAPMAKFCASCGRKLVNACAKCGAELPAGTKFCPQCGEKV